MVIPNNFRIIVYTIWEWFSGHYLNNKKMVEKMIYTKQQLKEMRELYDDLQSSVIELENKWGDDIDDDCSYMDFIQATEDLQSFYDKHHIILDK